ncbi:MAG: 50S ribosomal protein L29 [Chitinophagia bacterium]|nr:50S ribosomal protein L29 [Chitinophagia bacterium]
MAKASKATRQDYRSLDNEALVNKIEDEQLRLKRLKFSHAVNPIENPLSIKIVRREIARMKTENRKRELGF